MKYKIDGNGAQFKVYIFDSEKSIWEQLTIRKLYGYGAGDVCVLFDSLDDAKITAIRYIREKEDKWETVFEGET